MEMMRMIMMDVMMMMGEVGGAAAWSGEEVLVPDGSMNTMT